MVHMALFPVNARLRGLLAAILLAVLALAGSFPAAAPALAQSGPALAFHAVIDGEQQGPFDRAGLIELIEAGKLTRRTKVWRQGMTHWEQAGAILVLALLIDGHGEISQTALPPAEFYAMIEGVRRGPLGPPQIENLIATAMLTPETMVWRYGMEQWQAAGTVEELAPFLAGAPAEPADGDMIRVRAWCARTDKEGFGRARGFGTARDEAIKACVAAGGLPDCCRREVTIIK